ncbi:sulfite exporter TauE/SafE family protein [Pseudoflavitalea sp. G-6-1-2]|uniref:sulfite exporter TauE/SafE family protein n=1 Tax=Pseudoflavitalea sp. G-6-1-2 TaxID=2728841 RepID=UPI00146D334F|nr:sulfite exporter TauE/SafE family protein [Pseudoflavitalea sp. G-6-1-2]NML22949.1 sulfite exporter TauE/SafE family protein [Pseudoflavitalea sp. G-6-1-2]
MWQLITAGGLLGLMSSAHCVGMCGPLAMALPIHHLSKPLQLLSILLYHSGRILTYALLGLLFGIAGRTLHLAGLQQWFSIITGSIMLVIAVYFFMGRSKGYPAWVQAWFSPLQQLMGRVLRQTNTFSYLLLGMLNGLLPCGMVYLAVIGALSTTDTAHSVMFMTMFGIGTFPAMFLLSWFGIRISMDLRTQFRKLVPFVVAAMGVILILRGMNLGIPFISPVLADAPGTAVSCH